MNERIMVLMLEAGYAAPEIAGRGQKLAELIVRECMSMCKTAVGNRDYNTGRMHCYDNIKQHFGVEE